MNSYLSWNSAVARHFFRPEMAGRPVWLYVNEETVEEIGKSASLGGVREFVDAVKEGPPWANADGLCQQALQALAAWGKSVPTNATEDYPPYVAYLALFVLAAGLEGDFAPHAYYPRLRQLLGKPQGGQLPSFDRMIELWDDLERWSTQVLSGQLGVFTARIAGGWIHVGFPLAQTILSEEERKALRLIFGAAGLDPTSVPPEEEIARLLRTHGRGVLRKRTVRLVEQRHDNERLGALLDEVSEELSEWDGSVDQANLSSRQLLVLGALRLCLRIDQVTRTVQAQIRCSTKRELPDEGLRLTATNLEAPLVCEEELPGWSSPLKHEEVEGYFDASVFNWDRGLTLTDAQLGWEFRLKPATVRIFETGHGEGLPGLVEVHGIKPRRPFYIAFRDAEWSRLQAWAETDCEAFEKIPMDRGLPSGWILARSNGARSDAQIRRIMPHLSFPEQVRIRLVGGVRSGPGTNFFFFAPPVIVLEGIEGNEQLTCDGMPIPPDPSRPEVYELPPGVPPEKRLTVEVSRNKKPIRRRSLFLTGAFEWRCNRPVESFDVFGKLPSKSAAARVSGAVVSDVPGRVRGFKRPLTLARGLDPRRDTRIFLIGRRPGQVIRAYGFDPAEEWDPIWVVPMRRRGTAIYCGSDTDASSPAEEVSGSSEGLELWKDVLWYRRKRITPPRHPGLRRLWDRYVEAARNV